MAFHLSPHIALEVDNAEAATSFYEQVLGMQPIVEGVQCEEGERAFCKGPMTFYIGSGGRGNVFFEFRVDDMAEAEAALVGAGCMITHEYSEKSKMIADPYGLRFHLWQE